MQKMTFLGQRGNVCRPYITVTSQLRGWSYLLAISQVAGWRKWCWWLFITPACMCERTSFGIVYGCRKFYLPDYDDRACTMKLISEALAL